MKILYPHITQNLGGVEKRFFSYFKYILQQDDNDYTILISRSFLKAIKQNLISVSKQHKVIKYGFPWKNKGRITRYFDYIYLMFMLAWLKTKKYDIVHMNTSASRMFRTWFNARKRVISAVTSPRDWLEREISSPRFIKMVNSGYGVDCLDSNIQSAIQQKFPRFIENVFVAPCSFIAADLPEKIVEKEHAITYVGRLIPEKGADLLLQVLPEVINRTSYKIYILGNGTLKPKFEKIISENNWEDRILLTYDECPPRYMLKSEVFLSLQRDENYPSQSLLEAMFCNNAVIATNVGLTNLLVSSDNGILINNKKDLIDTLCCLESNYYELKGMMEKSKLVVAENHTIQRFHSYLCDLYKSILK